MTAPDGSPDDYQDAGLWTVPNAITLVRLAVFPLFFWLLFSEDRPFAAAMVLGCLGGTDWVDGYVARRFNQVSEVGKILDPVADRVLLLGGIGAILWVGAVPTWVAVAALAREALVAVATLALAAAGARRIDVTWVGKAGAFGMMLAFPAFLAASGSDGAVHTFFIVNAWLWTIPGLGYGWLSAARYVPLARAALAEGRQARQEDVRPSTTGDPTK